MKLNVSDGAAASSVVRTARFLPCLHLLLTENASGDEAGSNQLNAVLAIAENGWYQRFGSQMKARDDEYISYSFGDATSLRCSARTVTPPVGDFCRQAVCAAG